MTLPSKFLKIKETFKSVIVLLYLSKSVIFVCRYLSKGSCACRCVFHLLAEVQVMCIEDTPGETHPFCSLVVLRQPTILFSIMIIKDYDLFLNEIEKFQKHVIKIQHG